MNRYFKLSLIAAFIFGFALFAAAPVQAASIDEDGVVESDETIDDDLLLSGETVTMDGEINGILFAAGETVTVNGVVNGDAILIGKEVILGETAVITGNVFTGASAIEVASQISGSLIGGSGSLVLKDGAKVNGNVYYGGYSLEVQPEAAVGMDLLSGSYQVTQSGKVARDFKADAGAVVINGEVGRNVELDLGHEAPGSRQAEIYPMSFGPDMPSMPKTLPTGLTVSESAVIGGKLTYTSAYPQQSAIQTQPQDGVVFQTPTPVERPEQQRPTIDRIQVQFPVLGWLFDLIRETITLLVIGGLALWLAPRLTQRLTAQAQTQPLPSLGYGLVTILVGYAGLVLSALIVIAVAVILAVITLGGLSGTVLGIGLTTAALAWSLLSFAVDVISKIIVALLVGKLLIDRIAPNASHANVWALFTGVILYALLHSIPFIGWIFALAATLIGVGAIWLVYRAAKTPAAIAA